MSKKKNKGKKTLTAMGAVVAAGLTPGIVAASAAGAPVQSPNLEITAADAVAIDGNTYSFDELFAMQQFGDGRSNYAAASVPPQHATRYGGPYKPVQPARKYGVPSPRPQPQNHIVIIEKTVEGLDTIQATLLDLCVQVVDADAATNGVLFSLDSDLTREIGMNDYQLKALKAAIEEHYGIEVSYNRFYLKGQLNTLRLISEYIYKLKTLWD